MRLLLVLFCAWQACAVSIVGRVVNSVTNEPVPQADLKLICLTDSQNRPLPCQDSTTKPQPDGTFQIELRYPGHYRVQASAPGLVATKSSVIEIELDFRRKASDFNAVLKLAPEATLSGKVLDEAGQPKASVAVEALRISPAGLTANLRSVAKAITNDAGVYILRGLVSGNYYIATPLAHEDANDPSHPYLFFVPSAYGLDQAATTHVETGQSYSDVDIHLRPVTYFKLQGRAQMETLSSLSGDPPQLHLDARDATGVLLPARDILLNRDGTFQTEVLPGFYTLLLTGAQAVPQSKNSQTPSATVIHLLAKQDVEVSAKDLLGVLVLIPPPITVNGHAVLEGTTETVVAKGRLMVRPVDAFASGGPQNADIQPDGTFSLTNLDPANYTVRMFPPSGTYVKSLVFNQQDITNQLMDLSRGSGGELVVTLRPRPASMTGSVSAAADTLYVVTLIPEGWTPNGSAMVRHVASSAGHFTAANLPPGHYSVVATTGIDAHLWDIPLFIHEMEARGVGIDLAENDQKNVTVAYLSLTEVNEIQTRLGLD